MSEIVRIGQYKKLQSFTIHYNKMEEIVQIDGSLFEGGGQMIRSALALSLILNKVFTMANIRKNRPNPGINNQLRSVFSAFTDKLPKVGDSEIYFYPKFLQPTEIKASTAASCTLMMQCLIPVFTAFGYDKVVRINGGTDVSRSPPLQSIKLGLIPLLNRMGVNLQILDIKPGYYPVGKGYLDVRVPKIQQIRSIQMLVLGKPKQVVITYYVKDNKLPGSSKQLRKDIKKLLGLAFGEDQNIEFVVKTQKVFCTKDQYGIGCLILGQNLVWDVGTVGQKVNQESIISKLQHLVQAKCCLDQHHQDQLLLYSSLAEGTTKLLVGDEISLHTQSLIYIINKFLPNVSVTHQNQILSITGIGYRQN